jgi:hypothetical protein
MALCVAGNKPGESLNIVVEEKNNFEVRALHAASSRHGLSAILNEEWLYQRFLERPLLEKLKGAIRRAIYNDDNLTRAGITEQRSDDRGQKIPTVIGRDYDTDENIRRCHIDRPPTGKPILFEALSFSTDAVVRTIKRTMRELSGMTMTLGDC